ncbi:MULTISPECIES: DUF2218 domain-containing protein [Salipiger]|uniref:DUF2218 domain-containing protein n=1 Tax=Salipiger TaxID=263377 RepID=UPI000C9254D0|nr:DUF2218 domain-containing protein [Salipiger bermudensis]MAE88566.1 2,4-dihydroxyhept-2-ene-1,7-dioic acid aldolase [Pelagibaca sp.]MBN9676783.1 DUF2218 domain-containing protein [Salipiger bermudensis]MBR9890633.1 DUF2218 domain-containing protein [bacterium]MCA1286661.1 DUF2218 domain-containing protein [Salipiger bermudensis]|tara:strand:- start:325 stop:609 length:285 start_codon:yes stop_codon:yes gene_type:complete
MALQQSGTFQTPNASKYLQQLCKHFEHKVAVVFDESEGRAALPPGPALLSASAEALLVEISARTEADLERARFIIDDHLKRFAFREGCEGMTWA